MRTLLGEQLVLILPNLVSAAAACIKETPQRVKCTWANVGETDKKVLQFAVTGTEAGTFVNTARVSSTAPGVKDQEATVPVTLLPLPVPPLETVSRSKIDTASCALWLVMQIF
jgi:hypothetical protein